MLAPPFGGVRRATLADVAEVARLTARSHQEVGEALASGGGTETLSAPEIALRLLEDLEDGSVLYVAERDGRIAGFAHVTGLMVGDGGHLVELRQLYIVPDQRRCGIGRRLLRLVQQEVGQRANSPMLRAWAPAGSPAAAFLEMAGGTAVRPRWKVSAGDMAMRGVVFGWSGRRTAPVRGHPLA